VDYFNDQVVKEMSSSEDITREDVLPIISSPKYQLINVYRDGLTYLSPVTKEGRQSSIVVEKGGVQDHGESLNENH
jgi:hypothetical protein